MPTRRSLITLALSGAFPPRVRAASDFWNEKDPKEWSDKENQRVLSHSPWAKDTSVQMEAGGGGPGGGGGRRGGRGGGGMPGPIGGAGADASMGSGSGGAGGGRAPGGGPELGGGGAPQMPQLRALIRWESAAPVRAAAKSKLPPETNDYYVVSMSGVPIGGWGGDGRVDPAERQQAMARRLKAGTTLERKGKDPIGPEKMSLLGSGNGPAVVFLFPRTGEPIVAEDKEVTFHSKLGLVEIRTKFALKDMVYHGKLEL